MLRGLTDSTQQGKMLATFYVNSFVSFTEEVAMMNFNGFVSAFGGNLGLFLGFSCLSSIFAIAKFLQEKKHQKSMLNNCLA